MFSSYGIKPKLISAFTAAALVSVIVGFVAYFYSSGALNSYRSIAKENVPNLETFIEMKAAQVEMIVPIATLVGSVSTPQAAAQAKTEIDEWNRRLEEAIKRYEALPFADGEMALWKNYSETKKKPFIEMTYELVRLSGTGNHADQELRDKLYSTDYAKLRLARRKAFDELVEFQVKDSASKEKLADDLFQQMNVIILLVVGLGFLFAMIMGVVIARYLARALNSASVSMTSSAAEVDRAVKQLSSAAGALSAASREQAAAVQETAASVEEINAMVQKNSESASASAQVSEVSKRKAQDGKLAVERMVSSMNDIHVGNQRIQDQIEASNQKFSEIVNVIREIGGRTKVINDIVFQTKLLSFNASVEAARAGEHGKGFAVVAEEVGNLAQMSGTASVEIAKLLEESIQKVEAVVSETKTSVSSLILQARETVNRGNATAQDCGNTLGEIVENVARLSEMVSGISTASQEQSHGVQEINQAVHEIDRSTQENASATEKTSASVTQLSLLVNSLQEGSKNLRALVHGAAFASAGQTAAEPFHAAPQVAKVVTMKQPSHKATISKTAMKKAAGADFPPSADDPGFEDL